MPGSRSRNWKIVIPIHVRGLEWGIVPSVKQHRRSHAQEVLDVQEQIRGRLSSEMRNQVLSMRAIRSSRPSRVMARLVGEGDATCASSTVRDDESLTVGQLERPHGDVGRRQACITA